MPPGAIHDLRSAPGLPPASALAPTVATLHAAAVTLVVLVDVAASARHWGYVQFLLGRYRLAAAPGLRFFKMLGSGHDGGFGLRPSASRQGMFCVFDSDAHADAFRDRHPVVCGYRERATEFFSVKLRTLSCRGSWSGRTPLHVPGVPPPPLPDDRPVAALTRASIRPRAAAAFWRHAPDAETSLDAAPGCLLAAGLGEAPLLRQATISIWRNTAAMDAYARQGAHLEAIRAAARHDFFSESMFVRFAPFEARGAWKGRYLDLDGVPSGDPGSGRGSE